MSARNTAFSRWDRYEQYPATTEAGSEFGAVLRRLRTAKRLSQSHLAERCEVDPSCICRLESGGRMPSRPTVDRIGRELATTDPERRDLLRAAGFHPDDIASDPLLDELAASLNDPNLPTMAKAIIRETLRHAVTLGRLTAAGWTSGRYAGWIEPRFDGDELIVEHEEGARCAISLPSPTN